LRRTIAVRPTTEDGTEHMAKSLAHGAVDEEVEWECDCDATVKEQRCRVARLVAKHIHVERVFDNNEQQ